jgi:VIT1/CCC1 family predicted Fe2+/Mn2+ transporter
MDQERQTRSNAGATERNRRFLGVFPHPRTLLGRRRPGTAAGEHVERHFLNSETVRDVVIGMADGLTVPFALAAGVTAAIASTRIVVTAGLAEIVAGAIAMGLGGYLAAKSDQEHFRSEEKREYAEVDKLPEQERKELRDIFAEYGLEKPELDAVVAAISSDKKRWVAFMMRFELGLEKPDPKRAPISAATIATAYFVGGLIPLAPYMIEADVKRALFHSAIVTGCALLVFGTVKGNLTGVDPLTSGAQTLLVGGLAAGAAYYLASFVG